MAGEGIKLFLSGDVLTASDLNGYLMDQAIAVFADATERDNAFGDGVPVGNGGSGKPLLTAGRFCYLLDLQEVQYYNGSIWQASSQFSIEDGAVTESKIAANAVTGGKIASGAVTEAKIGSGAVTDAKLASNAVTEAKIASGAVTSSKIADGTIVNVDINAAAAIDKTKISGTAITAADTGTVTTNMIEDGAVTATKLGNDVTFVPAGIISPFAGSSAPSGWLLCYGQAVSRTTYSALFSVISTTYGVGDNSTTFNLPDLRGRVIAGVDNMGGSAASRLTDTTITGGADALGEVGGAQTHLLTGAESGTSAHSHTASSNTTGAHAHAQIGDSDPGGTGIRAAFNGLNTSQSDTGSAGSHNHSITVNNATAANASSAHNNVQPTMVLNYIIKF